MDLLQNPFHILSASPRDNRHRITELADEHGLLRDPEAGLKAHSELTHPRKRLSAEIAWLPGLSPIKAKDTLLLIESNAAELRKMDNLSDIVRLNLLAAGLSRLHNLNSSIIAEWILDISGTFDLLDAKELCSIINEDRVVSGFPEVTDCSWVENELNTRRQYCKGVIISALENLPNKERITAITNVVESATDKGKELGPILIHDIVDAYELESQAALEKGEIDIKGLVEKINTYADTGGADVTLSSMIDELIAAVEEWDHAAQPIQVSKKSLGLDHDASKRLAYVVRGLAIDLFNKHSKLNLAQGITAVLQKLFSEVPDVAELTAKDADTLETHEKARDTERIFGGLKPISKAPSLRTVNGIGFKLYGATDPEKESSSVISTYYFVFFFIPILPICRYRVIQSNGIYHFLGKAPLRDFDKWHLGIVLTIITVFTLNAFIGNSSGSNNSSYSSPNYQEPTTSQTYNEEPIPSAPDENVTIPDSFNQNQSYQSSLANEIEIGKAQAKELEDKINEMNDKLHSYKTQMESYQADGNYDAYNELVPISNSLLEEKNTAYEKYKNIINEVNQKVEQYNAGLQ